MFGTNSNSIFGSTGTSGGLFGSLQNQSQQPKPSLFGSAQPAQPATGGLFGGQSASTSLFAQNSAQPQQQSGGLFGAQPTAVVGTTVKFVPVTATDTMLKGGTQSQINTKTMCITAMTEYQNKCVEELRLEDYIAGRKVGKPGTSTLFGQQPTAPAAGGGLFQQKEAQSTGGGMFGGLSAFATKPAATTQANTGFFSQKTSLFGNATSTAVSSSGGLFGTQAQNQPNKSLFQTPTTQAGAGLFGGGTQTGGIFSQPAQPATQQPATGAFGGFGATGQTTGFGGFKPTTTTQPSMFNTGQTGAFGQTAALSTGTGFFGSGTAAVSQPTMFGQTSTQPATSSIFGPNAAVGGLSLFPNPNQQSSALPALGGGFGTQGGGLFQQPVANVNNAAAMAAIAVPQLTTAVSLSSRARQEIIEAQLAALPYGDSPLLKPSSNKSVDLSTSASSPIDASVSRRSFPRFLATTSTTAASVSPIMSTTASQQSTTSTLSRPKPLPGSNTTLDTSSLMNSSFSYKPIISLPSAGFGTALGVSSSFSNSPNGTALKNRSYVVQDDEKSGTGGGNLTIGSNASSRSLTSRKIKTLDVSVVQREGLNNSVLGVSFTDSTHQPSSPSEEPRHVEPSVARPPQQPIVTPAARPQPVERDPVRRSIEERNRPIEISGSQSGEPPANRHQSPTRTPPQPALARANATSPTAGATTGNFICVPSVEELRSRMTRDGKYSIDEEGLTIARSGLGAVHWPGPFTISRLDFERIVVFRPREITVYAEEDANKPPVGEELNRLAEVTLENIWPLDKNKKPITKQQELIRLRFRERLIGVCERMGAEFCDYNLLEGMWTFKVSHFSKYGYLDDDYDNETILAKMARMDDDEEYEAGKYYITQEELNGVGEPLDFTRISNNSNKAERKHVEPCPPVFQFSGLSKNVVQQSKLNRMTTFSFRKSCRVSFGDNLTLITTAEPGGHSTVIRPLRVMPAICLEEILRSFLSMRNRLDEFEELKRTELLRMYPPSQFLQLIDSFILELKNTADLTTDEKLLTFCEAVLLPPSPTQEIEQRVRFGNWLRHMLADSCEEAVANIVSPFRRIYTLLLHGAVRKAVDCAVEAQLYDLSMLMSMYITPPGVLVQGQVLQQLKFYTACGGITGENTFYGRILQLLSNSWKPTKDEGDLSWMHRLGAIIWYTAEPSTSLTKCVELFALERC